METSTTHHAEHSHHSTWISHVIERIEDAIEDMNVDFPLSGGAPVTVHHHHHVHTHHAHARTPEEIAEEQMKRAHWKASLHHFLDTDFPLSGGQ